MGGGAGRRVSLRKPITVIRTALLLLLLLPAAGCDSLNQYDRSYSAGYGKAYVKLEMKRRDAAAAEAPAPAKPK